VALAKNLTADVVWAYAAYSAKRPNALVVLKLESAADFIGIRTQPTQMLFHPDFTATITYKILFPWIEKNKSSIQSYPKNS